MCLNHGAQPWSLLSVNPTVSLIIYIAISFLFHCSLFRKHTPSPLRASHAGSLLFQAQSAQLVLGSSWKLFRCDPSVTATTTQHKAPKVFCCETQTHGVNQHPGTPPSSRSSLEEALPSQKSQVFFSLGRSGSYHRFISLLASAPLQG